MTRCCATARGISRALPVLLLLLSLAGPARPADGQSTHGDAAPASTAAPGYDEIATAIVHRSADVREDELVWIQGAAGDLPLMERLAIAVAKVGGHPVVTVFTDEMLRRWYAEVPDRFDARRDEWIWQMTERADVIIEFHSLDPSVFGEVPPERLAAWLEHNAGAAELTRGDGPRIVYVGNSLYPSEGNARALGVERADLERTFWNGVMADPEHLAATGEALADVLRDAGTIRITHPNGTDITVASAGLGVVVTDGRVRRRAPGSTDQDLNMTWLPSGEVTLGLDAGSAEGRLVLERLVYDGAEIRNVTLEFAGGRLASMRADSDVDRLRAVLHSDPPTSERLTGLKFGLNPAVSEAGVTTLMGAGMVSLSMGSNIVLGGDIDLPFVVFLTMDGSTVEVDGRVVVREGALLP
jgi:aminopeptidase